MQDLSGNNVVKGFGPGPHIAAAYFTPQNINTAQVLTENWGISQIIRSTGGQAGRWTVSLSEKPKRTPLILLQITENDTTNYHFVDVDSVDVSAGTFIVRHRTIAFASVASGPALSDAIDAIGIFVYETVSL